MKIFFGTYSYTIKRFSHEKVAVDGFQLRNLDFQLKMKVNHFMFIPIMGLEKYWVIKDKDSGKSIDQVDERVKRQLDLLKYKTKSLAVVFGYTGVIVPILVLALFFGNFLFKEVGKKAGSVIRDAGFVSALKNDVKEIKVGDRIFLKILFLKRDERSLKKKLMVEDKHQIALRVEQILEEEYVVKYVKVKQYTSERLKQFELDMAKSRTVLKVKKEKLLKAAEYAKPSNQTSQAVGLTRRVGGVGITSISEEAIFYLLKVVTD